MNRKKRLEIAQQTLDIIETGGYLEDQNQIHLKKQIDNSIQNSIHYTVDAIDNLYLKYQQEDSKFNQSTVIKILEATTLEAAKLLKKKFEKVTVLNFASAKNPGGRFLSGSSAQEESIARSSSLYPTLLRHMDFYNTNRQNNSFLYNDAMIYSPDVVVWFDDEGNFLEEPYTINVITSPAPNKGAMLQNNRNDELEQLEFIFEQRMAKVLTLAVHHNTECIILGAWGCGVFHNDPQLVATLFKKVILEQFPNSFKEICFAIYDPSEQKKTLNPFMESFKN